jgi:mono/diheme cytochrome c family protein
MRAPLLRTLHRASCGAAFALSLVALADGTPFFSADQVANGRFEYSQKCALCHGSDLQGAGAPAIRARCSS